MNPLLFQAYLRYFNGLYPLWSNDVLFSWEQERWKQISKEVWESLSWGIFSIPHYSEITVQFPTH